MLGAIAAVSLAMFSDAGEAGLNDAVYYSVVIDRPGAQFTPQSIRFFRDDPGAKAAVPEDMAAMISAGDQSTKSCS